MFSLSDAYAEHRSVRHTFVQFFRGGSRAVQCLNAGSWLRLALVFTILTGGLLVAFFGITVRVEAATSTRFTPVAPPTSRQHPRPILLNRIPRRSPRAHITRTKTAPGL